MDTQVGKPDRYVGMPRSASSTHTVVAPKILYSL